MVIQKESIKTYVRKALPSWLDVAYSATAVLIVLFVALLPTIVDQYNLFGTRSILRSDIGGAFTGFLAGIDSFSFTDTVVTFLSGFTHAVEDAEHEYELMSKEYVRPLSVSAKNIWHEKVAVSILSFISLLAFIMVAAAVLLVLFPIATIHLRAVIASATDPLDIAIAAAAAVLLLIGTCAGLITFRLWRHRKILLERVEG